MAFSPTSSLASYVSLSPPYSPIENTGGLSTYQFPPIHHTNTAGLSLLLESMPADHQANPHARMSWYGDSPPAYASYPTPLAPPWSPITPYQTPQPPPWSPLTRSPSHSPPRPQHSPSGLLHDFVPEPVDMDALLEDNPFRLAEEYGGNMITDRTRLNWIEGHRLPSLDEIGLDQYLQFDRPRASSSRDMGDVRAMGQLLPSFGGESGSERMLRLSKQRQ